jgi:hypothetical protein
MPAAERVKLKDLVRTFGGAGERHASGEDLVCPLIVDERIVKRIDSVLATVLVACP